MKFDKLNQQELNALPKIKDHGFPIHSLALFLLNTTLFIVSILFFYYYKTSYYYVFPVLLILAYISFTPMHEATHKNYGEKGILKLLNHFIGFTASCITWAPFTTFSVLHLDHHKYTNNPKKDPDYWVSTQNKFVLIFKCLTIWPRYVTCFCTRKKNTKSVMFKSTLQFLFIFSISYLIGWKLTLTWFIASLLALSLNALLLDWLVHTPYDALGGKCGTRIVVNRCISIISLGNCIHQIHHVSPHISHFDLAKTYKSIKK